MLRDRNESRTKQARIADSAESGLFHGTSQSVRATPSESVIARVSCLSERCPSGNIEGPAGYEAALVTASPKTSREDPGRLVGSLDMDEVAGGLAEGDLGLVEMLGHEARPIPISGSGRGGPNARRVGWWIFTEGVGCPSIAARRAAFWLRYQSKPPRRLPGFMKLSTQSVEDRLERLLAVAPVVEEIARYRARRPRGSSRSAARPAAVAGRPGTRPR